MKENSIYNAFWTKVTDLMRLGSPVSVIFWVVRFWFIPATLVIHKHLVLTAQAKMRSTSYKVPPTLISLFLNPLQTS